ncbi:MAG: efflux RND transporter periplasmic adaptor subunit [Steroidobacteraceae bacterium]
MKTAAVVVAATAIAGLAGAGFWAWRAGNVDATPNLAARVVTPARRTVAAVVLATGAVRPRVGAEVRVGSQVSGIVDELNVTVGSHVQQGEVLARIDARALDARRAQARAQIRVIEQDLARAQVELARVERLVERQLVAVSQVEDRRLDLAGVEARLEKARRDAAVIDIDMAYTVIRAPISGTVASVTTQKGETVAASFTAPTFVTIIGDDALQLIALVDETDIGAVALGNAVSFSVEAFPADEFSGMVERIAPRGTIISGVVNYEVMVAIEPDATRLKPDMTANIRIATAETEALVVPDEAIQRDGAQRWVWVEEDGRRLRRDVTIGSRQGGQTEVRRGLAPTDRVIILPAAAAAGDTGSAT